MDNDAKIYEEIEAYVQNNKYELLNKKEIKEIIKTRKIHDEYICDYLTKFFMTYYIIHNGTPY